MTILVSDLKLFAGAFPVDETYGGGLVSSVVVQNGVENTLFPSIDAAARAAGRVQMRKVFSAVTSADADTLSGAQIGFRAAPADAAVHVLALQFGDQRTTRSAAAAALAAEPMATRGVTATVTVVAGANLTIPGGPAAAIVVGDMIAQFNSATGFTLGAATAVGVVTALATDVYTVTTIYGAFVVTNLGVGLVCALQAAPSAPKCVGPALVTVAASSGASTVVVARVLGQLVPAITPYPAAVAGFDPSKMARTQGSVPIFRAGDSVLLRNGVTNEVKVVASVNYAAPSITFTAPLTNAYAVASVVCALLPMGDMRSSVGASFSQQTWTKVFADTIIGASIGANYNRGTGVITIVNQGAATERWALVFTSATAFNLIGENFGQIGAGVIGSAFAPNNPLTGFPYFTIPAAGWGSGWAIGNVLRFNTMAAAAPFWTARTISPSAPGGLDGSTLEFRGSVSA